MDFISNVSLSSTELLKISQLVFFDDLQLYCFDSRSLLSSVLVPAAAGRWSYRTNSDKTLLCVEVKTADRQRQAGERSRVFRVGREHKQRYTTVNTECTFIFWT